MKVTVVGDLLLDVDINGTATRLSPDAPVPVVDVGGVRRRAGGAGLVATLLMRDGHDVTLVTAVSDDDGAAHLRRALSGMELLTGAPLAPTPTKTRVRIGSHPVVRFDEGCAPAPTPDCTGDMRAAIDSAEVIVVADYGRGITFNEDIRDALTTAARRIPVVWDPHPSGSQPVSGVSVVTPNLAEARTLAKAAGLEPVVDPGAGTAQAGTRLLEHWNSRAVLVTKGEAGAVLVEATGPATDIPAPRTSVADPCGAGDRLAGSLAAYLGLGVALPEAASRAVADASAFLSEGGAASLAVDAGAVEPGPAAAGPDPADAVEPGPGAAGPHADAGAVVELFGNQPSRPDGVQLAAEVRAQGGTVIATGGCFDLLHAGHARTLAAARAMGDCLIVCLNSDQSVRRLKGPHRPIVSMEDRAELLLALSCVDAVVVFDEDTPEDCLEFIRPDIWVKGGDYQPDELPEARLLATWGGQCVTVPFHPARSTSGLAEALAKVG
ncbi:MULTISPECIES: D-glycero-beta-D-manno-heptose 1-phosphate adenylyltransferase [Paenarthrobacter]|uniref:D-glycero-beta-D-manno-heptose 1-phosphate adenylyltransferase n=1 Tax=Paenarthrobacter ureafaciens TaxID=37931 RepID=A0AAX3EIF2_PAEUR|nr:MULTISPECIES: D-glycero-beta-D-manno-heptose 1-phosphate adenylyltransferase [Paenarthrobacter]OEH57627.1 D-beta-D-heptose 1-phosphate adenosyltransferase [Arthrobacter sp. D4]OEH58903.1 D-beta-D-heptose 1-phosphate adenosyltransferase [Arthrobacter sp. D2]MDO5862717.1 D-glycero-beta-D-manno-heptose 1-phosphate adenylyltransferase [Paenarthrobacter sp. SD-2]MDO5873790.1 D-glycero-beta-D-manno-heptose 1-phosphate adenylyltransferase [Paenarthrobacter sp. SD-1]QMU80818.1 D-glycero-beta-D-mann